MFEEDFNILGLVVCGAILRMRTSRKTGTSGQEKSRRNTKQMRDFAETTSRLIDETCYGM